MDTKKIGEFLKTLRKENNLTQEQLGERLGVTNKTVSRWENGNYMPPIECLKLLSELYDVSINEIISGERLKKDDYKNAAERNISSALEKAQNDISRFERSVFILMAINTIIAVAAIFLTLSREMPHTVDSLAKQIIMLVLIIALSFISNVFAIVSIALKKG